MRAALGHVLARGRGHVRVLRAVPHVPGSDLLGAHLELYYANSTDDAARIGFDDPEIYHQVTLPGHHRDIPTERLLQAEAIEVFCEWEDKDDKFVLTLEARCFAPIHYAMRHAVRIGGGGESVSATVKCTVAKAGHDYMRAAYGHHVWSRMLDMLSPEERVLVANIGATPNFPVAVDGKLFEALVAVQFQGSRRTASIELRKGGASQADAMLDGLFSIFARFVSPHQAFSRGGSIITSVYSRDVTSRTEPAVDGKGGAIRVFGLGESSYIAPWQCGWIERAAVRFGGDGARVIERSWESGLNASPELVYDVRWE